MILFESVLPVVSIVSNLGLNKKPVKIPTFGNYVPGLYALICSFFILYSRAL